MKKLLLVFTLIFSIIFTNVNAYNSFYTTYNNNEKVYSYDYYMNGETVKKYAYDSNSRNGLKICLYSHNGKK